MSKEKANERINRQSSSKEQRKSRTAFIIAFAAVAVCAVIGIIAFAGNGKDDVTSYNRVVTPENVDEVLSNLAERDYTPIGSYETTMNTSWTFPDGDSASTNAYVENSVNNQNTVFFTIVLQEDQNQTIYTSPEIPVGSHLENIKLDTPLEAGVYETIITYHLIDENHKELSHVNLALTITIEK